MIIETLPVEVATSRTVPILVFVILFVLINAKYFIQFILIKKNIIAVDTKFKSKKFNIFYAAISIALCIAASGVYWCFVSLDSALFLFIVLLSICQLIYFVLRIILDYKNSLKK